jgi:hypothetical protein
MPEKYELVTDAGDEYVIEGNGTTYEVYLKIGFGGRRHIATRPTLHEAMNAIQDDSGSPIRKWTPIT